MSPSPAADGARLPSVAEANDALRKFSAGRVWWTPEALAELARLRAVWLKARQAEPVRAA